LASSLLSLVLALTVTGAASGALDVGINANVSRIESATGRRLMPLAHALYSAGILVGAVAAGLARSAGAGRESILLGVAAASAVATVTTLGYLGLLTGPPLVGGVGQAVSLRGSFVVLAVIAAAVAAAAIRLRD